ncbi:MAG: YceH family protein [Acidobacteriota bacterium]
MEIRVLGVLLEKEQTTPDYYPMTLNAIRMACNQKTNRFPVMSLGEDEVQEALESLDQYFLVARAGGTRADHWKHRADLVWNLNPASQALLTLLFLRGPQTPGELRTRSERMHAFASVQEVEAALGELAASSEPLARELARRPGQKEARWAAESTADLAGQSIAPIQLEPCSSGLDQRVARLEQIVERLEEELKNLQGK